MHMAISAVVNALWDLAAKRAGKPLWKLLSDLSPEELVELVDFRYLTDALTPDEALEILRRARAGRRGARGRAAARGYPAYTTTPGWLGLLRRQARAAVPGGGRRRLHADQAQGRGRPRGRRPPPADRARGLRAGHPDRGRRQPALGRRRRDPLDPGARAVRPLVGRGADEPGRRARPRRDPARGRADPRSPPASTCRTA